MNRLKIEGGSIVLRDNPKPIDCYEAKKLFLFLDRLGFLLNLNYLLNSLFLVFHRHIFLQLSAGLPILCVGSAPRSKSTLLCKLHVISADAVHELFRLRGEKQRVRISL